MFNFKSRQKELFHSHSPDAIQRRVDEVPDHNYIGDFLLGAIDGLVTTFAVVAGVAGAHLSMQVALILGVANLLADGFSMAAGNFQNVKSDHDLLRKARRMEERHIEVIPEGEIEEVRQIYARKGFSGELLEEIVQVITSDRDRWVNTMLTEELGLKIHIQSPWKSALTTFLAFFFIGLVPLLPYVLPFSLNADQTFFWSAFATGCAFFVVGAIKGKTTDQSVIKSGFETFLLGGSAALVAFLVGRFLHSLVL